MRILKKKISHRNGEGLVRLQADEPEDMYHLFNLVCEGDLITANTVRNVVKESSTGSTVKQRMNMKLKIKVERIEFDAEQCALRINGRNMQENEFVKMGQYHTIDLGIDSALALEKTCWDSVFLDLLVEASDPGKKADLAVIVMQEGLANICLVTTSMTIIKVKIERRMPKKMQLNNAHDKARAKFFEEVYEGLKRHVDFTVVKALIVGSPGFLNADFLKYLMERATRVGDIELIKQKFKFLKAHTSSGHKGAIDELLGDDSFKGQLLEVKAADEVRALQAFYDALSLDPDRACYAFQHCLYADEQLAIDTLLVTDKLFKSADFNMRRRYVQLVESVKDHGGKVFIFSSMHVSGEQLDLYTGVAAILRFPLPDIDPQLEPAVSNTSCKNDNKIDTNLNYEIDCKIDGLGEGKSSGYDSDFSDSTVDDEVDNNSEDESEDGKVGEGKSFLEDMGLNTL
jgi:protein pelota